MRWLDRDYRGDKIEVERVFWSIVKGGRKVWNVRFLSELFKIKVEDKRKKLMFRLEEIQTNFCSSRCGTVYFRDLSFEITERKLLSFKRHFLELFSYLFFLILLFLKTKIPVFDKIYLAGYKPFQKDPVPMFRPETHLKSIEFRDSLPPANPCEKVESWRNFSLPLSLHSRENPLSRFQKTFEAREWLETWSFTVSPSKNR